MAIPVSNSRGEKIKINPLSFTSAEKLETQNGMMKNRAVCQRSRVSPLPGVETLSSKAIPMTMLIPTEVIHNRGAGSK